MPLEQEFVRRDPLWLLESSGYLKIKTKEGKIVPLNPNTAQKKLISVIRDLQAQNKPVRIVILKARQEGISTATEGILYAYTSQAEGTNSLIIADDIDGSNYLLEMIKLYQDMMEDHLKPKEKKSNEKKLEFKDIHSQILVDTANNEKAGRKYTYRYAHLSEVAFFPPNKTKALMGGLMESVPNLPGTVVIAESTANGEGNYFHKLWTGAEKGQNDWYPLFLAWHEHDEYTLPAPKGFTLTGDETVYKQDVEAVTGIVLTNDQMYWRRQIIRNNLNGDTNLFKQEYPAYPAQAFLVSGRKRFDIRTMQYLKAQAKLPMRTGGNWEVYEEPQEGTPYIIGADVAEGLEKGDNSVAQIINPITCKQVAKYRGKIEPEAFGHELVIWGKKYNNALLAVEVNNHGLTTLTAIKNENYPLIYYRKVYDKVADTWTEKIGWQTSVRTKPYMIDNLATALIDGFEVIAHDTIDELKMFIVNDDGTCSAQEGELDDEVIALAVANQARIEGVWQQGEAPKRKAPRGSVAWHMEKDLERVNDWRSAYRR